MLIGGLGCCCDCAVNESNFELIRNTKISSFYTRKSRILMDNRVGPHPNSQKEKTKSKKRQYISVRVWTDLCDARRFIESDKAFKLISSSRFVFEIISPNFMREPVGSLLRKISTIR